MIYHDNPSYNDGYSWYRFAGVVDQMAITLSCCGCIRLREKTGQRIPRIKRIVLQPTKRKYWKLLDVQKFFSSFYLPAEARAARSPCGPRDRAPRQADADEWSAAQQDQAMLNSAALGWKL
jgi:hypothetical protein